MIASDLTRPVAPVPSLAPARGWLRAARRHAGRWGAPVRALAGVVGLALLVRAVDPAAVLRELSGAQGGWLVAALASPSPWR